MPPDAVLIPILLLAAGIDLRRRVIPDWLTLGGIGLCMVLAFADGLWLDAVPGLAAGLSSGTLLHWAGGRLFRRRIMKEAVEDPDVDCAFGPGDVKLMGLVGAALGCRGLLFVYLAASVAGAAAGIVLRRRVLPFAPFVAAGAVLRSFWFG